MKKIRVYCTVYGIVREYYTHTVKGKCPNINIINDMYYYFQSFSSIFTVSFTKIYVKLFD